MIYFFIFYIKSKKKYYCQANKMENNTKVSKEGDDKVIRELTKDKTKEFESNTNSVTLKSNSTIYPPLPRQNCVK